MLFEDRLLSVSDGRSLSGDVVPALLISEEERTSEMPVLYRHTKTRDGVNKGRQTHSVAVVHLFFYLLLFWIIIGSSL